MKTPLETALGAKRPLPASPTEECKALEVELLLPQHKRRIVTVGDHERLRASYATPRPTDRFDEIDDLVGDAERWLDRRRVRDADRVLRILDELEQGK